MINSESPIVMNGQVLYLLPVSRNTGILNKGIPKTRSLSDLKMISNTNSEESLVDRRKSFHDALTKDTSSTASAVKGLMGPFKTLQEAQIAVSLFQNKNSQSVIPTHVNLLQNANSIPGVSNSTQSLPNSNGTKIPKTSSSPADFLSGSKKLTCTKSLSFLPTKGFANKQVFTPASPDTLSKMQQSVTPSPEVLSVDNSVAGIKSKSFLPLDKENKPEDSSVNPEKCEAQATDSPVKKKKRTPTRKSPDTLSKTQANSSTTSPQVPSVAEIKSESFLPFDEESKPVDYSVSPENCEAQATDSPVKRKKRTPTRKKEIIPPITKVASLVFFDLETTGLAFEIGKSNVQITEVSMIAINRKEFEESKFDDLRDIRIIQKICLCTRPRSRVSSGAAAITGLSDANLMDQNPFERNAAEAINFFLSHLPKPVCLLAHNGNLYDFPLLKAEFSKLSMSLPSDILIADTLKAFRALGVPVFPPEKKVCKSVKFTKKGQVSYSLSNLHLYLFNKNPAGSHSSEGDCIALAKVCHRMKDLMLLWIDENSTSFDSVSPMW